MKHHQYLAAMRGQLRTVAALLALSLVTGAWAQGMVEGRNYAKLKNPQPVETGKNIEVIEFFSYGCPHCGELEPHLQAWLKNKPADVQLRRIPVVFQPKWESLARAFYTLDAMGEETRLAPDLFNSLHVKGNQLWNDKEFFDWAAAKGLDRKKVEDLYGSFAVVGKVNRAKQQAQVYQIQSVPTIIVDGKFTTGPERMPNGHAGVSAAIDALVVKARADRPKS
jgi:thiol:disulfide interchange protein DsbA